MQHRIALAPSLSPSSLEALERGLESGFDADVWVLHGAASVVSGPGQAPGVFCRGMDLAAAAGDDGEMRMALGRFARCVARLRWAPCPTVALVDGEVSGGGLGLAAACDVVIATPGSTFALPEALYGLLPGIILPVLLERMTPQKARMLTLVGTSRPAAWALEHGLCDEVVEDVERATARWAKELGRADKKRVPRLRTWLTTIPHLGADEALERGAEITASLVEDPEVREAVRAFVEDGVAPWVTRKGRPS